MRPDPDATDAAQLGRVIIPRFPPDVIHPGAGAFAWIAVFVISGQGAEQAELGHLSVAHDHDGNPVAAYLVTTRGKGMLVDVEELVATVEAALDALSPRPSRPAWRHGIKAQISKRQQRVPNELEPLLREGLSTWGPQFTGDSSVPRFTVSHSVDDDEQVKVEVHLSTRPARPHSSAGADAIRDYLQHALARDVWVRTHDGQTGHIGTSGTPMKPPSVRLTS